MKMLSSPARAEITTSVLARLYLIALATRFVRARESKSASARIAGAPGGKFADEFDAAARRDRVEQQQILFDQRFDPMESQMRLASARFQAGQIEIVVNHPRHSLSRLINRGAHLAPLLRVGFELHQHFAHSLDRGQRRLHLVRHKLDHVALHPLQFALFRNVGESGHDAERSSGPGHR